MDSHQYEKELKKEKDFQRKINSEEQDRVMGKVISAPFRAVGWLMKLAIKLVMLIVILAIIGSVIQHITTGEATILEFLKGF